jgi:hypothetical protein
MLLLYKTFKIFFTLGWGYSSVVQFLLSIHRPWVQSPTLKKKKGKNSAFED